MSQVRAFLAIDLDDDLKPKINKIIKEFEIGLSLDEQDDLTKLLTKKNYDKLNKEFKD